MSNEPSQIMPPSLTTSFDGNNETTTSIPICLCNHQNQCLTSDQSSPRILQNEIFICVFSSLSLQITELYFVQRRYRVDRIQNSEADIYTWLIHPLDDQSPHVIRTRLDPSFFTWRRRRWTTITIEGTLLIYENFVNSTSSKHDFTIPLPIQPAPFFPNFLTNPYFWCYILFWMTVCGLGIWLLGYMLFWIQSEWKIRRRKCSIGVVPSDLNKEIEQTSADP